LVSVRAASELRTTDALEAIGALSGDDSVGPTDI